MEVKLGNDFFYIKTPYADRHFVARGLNGIWSKKENMYRFPKNIHSMREVIRSYPQLKNNYGFVATGQQLQQVQQRFLTLKAKEDTEGYHGLRPYQRVDIAYLNELPSAGIFNEPRTGRLVL